MLIKLFYQYFRDLLTAEIKVIALEIAILGTEGIRPGRNDYKLNAIHEKYFQAIKCWLGTM